MTNKNYLTTRSINQYYTCIDDKHFPGRQQDLNDILGTSL